LRVLYDYQAFMQRQGGVSRYFAELIEALKSIEGFEAVLPLCYSDSEYLERSRTFITHGHFKGKVRIMSALNLIQARRCLRGEFDVLHPTYYQPYFLGKIRQPFVVTVHDMIHELFGGKELRNDGTPRNKRALCEKAAKIIAVSNNTRNDLCNLLRVSQEKVSVVHHATNLRYRGEARLHERPYLLYVGTRSGYKNFLPFLHAVSRTVQSAGVDIVCAGGAALTRAEMSEIRCAGLEGKVRHLGSLMGGDLASLYHFASVFCCPSLYEGFGIPLLEAFACGCPVAASRTSSLPEVAGSAAELFDPTSPESMADAVQRVLLDSERARALVQAGTERLRLFSWEASARKTFDVYREAVQ
jgi:glycosyltransferase involved in cell wall biosynthesis